MSPFTTCAHVDAEKKENSSVPIDIEKVNHHVYLGKLYGSNIVYR